MSMPEANNTIVTFQANDITRPACRCVLKGPMDIRPLTARYAVSPQIDPEDVPAIAAAGFTTLINNRPCSEIPPSHQADVMAQAAEAAGLKYVVLPIVHSSLGPDLAKAQAEACDASDGPVFAYCASGTRCTIVWAMAQAMGETMGQKVCETGTPDADIIVNAASAQGYDLTAMHGQLQALANAQS